MRPLLIQLPSSGYPLPLPSSSDFQSTIKDLAFPQVLAYSSAILGVLLVSLVLRSFSKS